MKPLVISSIFLITFLLISESSARPESVIMGPYKVSFDLNTTQKYTINVSQPESGQTYGGVKFVMYEMWLENTSLNYSLASIGVTFFGTSMDGSAQVMKSEIQEYLSSKGYYSNKDYDRIIDKKPGILGVGENPNRITLFQALYWSHDDTKVDIISIYPWEPETLGLLNSIHVELTDKPSIHGSNMTTESDAKPRGLEKGCHCR